MAQIFTILWLTFQKKIFLLNYNIFSISRFIIYKQFFLKYYYLLVSFSIWSQTKFGFEKVDKSNITNF